MPGLNQPPPSEDQDRLSFSERAEINWTQYLKDFREQVFPVFELQGISFESAFMCWVLNKVNNTLCEVADFLEKEEDA